MRVVGLSSGGAGGYGVTNEQLLEAAGFRVIKPSAAIPPTKRQRGSARPREARARRQRTASSSSSDPPREADDEPPGRPRSPGGVTDKSRVCEVCGGTFTSRRSDARTCSNRCRQQAFRDRQAQELAAARTLPEPRAFLNAAGGDPYKALIWAVQALEPKLRRAFDAVA